MTIFGMHTELDMSLQQVAANKTLKYLPEQYDWVLNKVQDEFIQSKLRPRKDGSGGFEIDQLSADQIRTLIVSGKTLIPLIDGPGRYQCFLPADYAYLISDWSRTYTLCDDKPPTQQSIFYLFHGIRQDKSTKTAPPYYETLVVNLAGKTVSIPSDLSYWHEYKGYKKVKDVQFLVPHMCSAGSWYWERLGPLFKPGYYLDAVHSVVTPPTIVVDGTPMANTFFQQIVYQRHVAEITQHAENRLTASSKVSGLLATKFYESKGYSPISELAGNVLYIYKDDSFIVSEVGITYVRKPRPMSLSLGNNSELPEEFHQTICDLAVEYLKGRLENQVGQAMAKDHNENRVSL